MNSAYNQTPLDKASRRLTDFAIEEQNGFKRLFYDVPPAIVYEPYIYITNSQKQDYHIS